MNCCIVGSSILDAGNDWGTRRKTIQTWRAEIGENQIEQSDLPA
jgi:hypothetical protein